MSDVNNPYAPPQANVDGGGSNGEYWREGTKVLYILRGSDLPPRCVKCNAPAVAPVRTRKLYWHHWGWYFLLLLRFFPYLIVALIVRKRFDVSPGLCERHGSARKLKLTVAWSLLVVSILGSWYSATSRDGTWLLVALVALFAAMVMAAVTSRIVYPVEITKDHARLKGFGEAFLASVREEQGVLPRHLRS